MRKGWRNDPNWCGFYEGQRVNREMLRQQVAMVKAQEDTRRLQQQMYEENARHNAECHARKVAAGEIQPTQAAH